MPSPSTPAPAILPPAPQPQSLSFLPPSPSSLTGATTIQHRCHPCHCHYRYQHHLPLLPSQPPLFLLTTTHHHHHCYPAIAASPPPIPLACYGTTYRSSLPLPLLNHNIGPFNFITSFDRVLSLSHAKIATAPLHAKIRLISHLQPPSRHYRRSGGLHGWGVPPLRAAHKGEWFK